MRTIAIDDVEVELSPLGVHSVRKPVSDALGTDYFAMNYFELEPGESFSGGLHAHHDQEEVFYVQSGEATFDVADRPDSSAVGAGGVIRFPPGQFQEGYDDPDGDDQSWGSPSARPPADTSGTRSNRCCTAPNAARRPAMASLTDEDGFRFICNECGDIVSFWARRAAVPRTYFQPGMGKVLVHAYKGCNVCHNAETVMRS